ncbi:MAG: SAM-dependent methyltransferase, partial [Erysipelotrichaceae bacterium]|nr:SAM-dependent methyltransferase [Erysipelotrichaceae bacterium]
MNILCPVCKNILHKSDKFYSCENRHSFDIAKEGYLNLNLKNSQKSGDNAEMIKARKAFLEKDYYSFLREEVDKYIKTDDELLDLACGEGY